MSARLLFGLFLGVAAVGEASALVVDDFATGPVVLVNGGGTFDNQTGAGIIGGERYVVYAADETDWILAIAALGGSTLAFTANSNDAGSVPPFQQAIILRYDGSAPNTGGQDLDGLGAVDFTESGASNAVRVRINEATAGFRVNVRLSAPDGGGGFDTFNRGTGVLPAIAGPTDLIFPLDEFFSAGTATNLSPTQATQIGRVEVVFGTFEGAPFFLGVDFVDTTFVRQRQVDVPTPASGLLLAAALIGLCAMRTRRRA